MRPPISSGGMETPLSLMLLVLSITLLASGASLLFHSDPTMETQYLRYDQTRDIGRCLSDLISTRCPFLSNLSKTTDNWSMIIWTGSSFLDFGDDSFLIPVIKEVLEWTPDGLWSMVLVFRDVEPSILIETPISTFVRELTPGLSMKIVLPIEKSPNPVPEAFS